MNVIVTKMLMWTCQIKNNSPATTKSSRSQVTGPWCSSRPLRSRRPTGELKSHLNTSVGEPIECNHGVINFLLKPSVIILDPSCTVCITGPDLHSGCHQNVVTARMLFFVLCGGHIICIVLVTLSMSWILRLRFFFLCLCFFVWALGASSNSMWHLNSILALELQRLIN